VSSISYGKVLGREQVVGPNRGKAGLGFCWGQRSAGLHGDEGFIDLHSGSL
jgi:hypothetical protein